MAAKSMCSGSYGATHSEKMPAKVINTMMTKLAAPSGCCAAKSSSAPRSRLAVEGAEDVTAVMPSPVADARVEHSIEQIDHEIDEDVENREHHDHALDQREVRARDA